MENKKNYIYFLIIIVLLIIIGGLSFMLIKDDKTNTDEPVIENKDEQKEDNNKEAYNDYQEMDEETSELYRLMPKHPESPIYQRKTLTVSDIPMDIFLYRVYDILQVDYKEEIAGSYKEELENGDECLGEYNEFSESCYVKGSKDSDWYAFKEETIKKYFNKFYGSDAEYKRIENFGTAVEGCHYEKGYYLCEVGGGYAFVNGFAYAANRYIKTETVNDEKYIFEKHLQLLYLCDENCKEDYDSGYLVIYKDSAKTEKLAKIPYDEELGLSDEIWAQADVYKHTYKKNSDGSYYWYSIELVK